jgi:hypothetical protein
MIYRYTAESWDEFVHDLRTRSPQRAWRSRSSEREDESSWSGCRDWNAALDYAVKGHAVARAAIDSVTFKVTSAPEPLWDTAPVGAFPCIPAYAAGAPEDMFTVSDIAPPVRSPIVRIMVNMSAHCGVDPQHIVNRGAAIVTLIDRIQSTGRRVELIAIAHNEDDDRFVWSVTVKRPEEPVDMDRVGLVFATPIMLRRFFFRVMEFTVPRTVVGYAYPTHFHDECSGADLVITQINSHDYDTPARANATVMGLWNAATQKVAA